MSQRTEIFDLGALRLNSGEGRRVHLSVPIEGFDLGGQRYESASPYVEIALDVSRTTTGYAMRIQFEALLEGPCMRCLGDASRRTPVDSYEIDQPGGGDANCRRRLRSRRGGPHGGGGLRRMGGRRVVGRRR